MMHIRKLIHLLIAILILSAAGSALRSPAPVTAGEPLPPEPTGKVDYSEGQTGISPERTTAGDNFGYTFNANISPIWKDITPYGTEINFSNLDEDYSDPLPIRIQF